MSELGSRLLRAREARGLTLEDAERDTRISRRYLQALETEQFEVIPAPVYARGFLRSYSQYLGLDPQAMLSLFPRDEEPEEQRPATTPARRASVREPLSAVGPARPAWRKPQPPSRAEQPARRAARPRGNTAAAPLPAPDEHWEPTIGIDIGVATPARRINPDPASQARTVTVVLVAIGAILGVALVAFLISRLGGDDGGTGASTASATGTATRGPVGQRTQAPAATATPSAAGGAAVEPGKVPDVRGLAESQAKAAVEQAGFVVKELRNRHAEPKNTVYDQAPAPGIEWPKGATVTLTISEGP